LTLKSEDYIKINLKVRVSTGFIWLREQWQAVLNVVMYLFIHKSHKISWGPHFSAIWCHITGQSVPDV